MRRNVYFIIAGFIVGVASATGALGGKSGDGKSTHIDEERGVSVTHIVNGDRGYFFFKDDQHDFAAEWRGEFTFSEDAKSIKSLERWIEIKTESDGVEREVRIESGARASDDAIISEYKIENRVQDIDENAASQIGEMVRLFARASGVQAEERVGDLIGSGGVDAVLTEIDALLTGHATLMYVKALTEKAALSDAQIKTVAARISTLDGDHAKGRALGALFEYQELSADAIIDLLGAARAIKGDHELRMLIDRVASRDLTPQALDIAMALSSQIEGSHEKYMSAAALLQNQSLTDQQAAKLIDLGAAEIEGSHDLYMLLDEALPRAAKSKTVAAAALRAISEIESDHERYKAVSEISSVIGSDIQLWRGLIAAAASIESDHEASMALIEIADRMPDDAELGKAYRDAAGAIGSGHERGRALEALGEQ